MNISVDKLVIFLGYSSGTLCLCFKCFVDWTMVVWIMCRAIETDKLLRNPALHEKYNLHLIQYQ